MGTDPGASVLSAAIILFSAYGLVKSCAMIVMQTTPSKIDTHIIRDQVCLINHVHGIHDLHIWQLTGSISICSLHAVVSTEALPHLNDTIMKIKQVLHKHGIHASTIQPEVNSLEKGGALLQNKGNCPIGACVVGCEADSI